MYRVKLTNYKMLNKRKLIKEKKVTIKIMSKRKVKRERGKIMSYRRLMSESDVEKNRDEIKRKKPRRRRRRKRVKGGARGRVRFNKGRISVKQNSN